MTELPSVNDVNQASQAAGLGATAAELHGGLCGWLSAGGAPVPEWPARVLADDNLPTPTAGDALDRLLGASVAQLEDRDFAFELLLSDSDDTAAQADALFTWARAFLGALAWARASSVPSFQRKATRHSTTWPSWPRPRARTLKVATMTMRTRLRKSKSSSAWQC